MKTKSITLILPIPAFSFTPIKQQSTPSSKLQVLFPNKRGIIVESDGDYIARDPLIDDFMGRRSSATDVLRNDNVPRGVEAQANSSWNEVNESMDPNEMRVRDIQAELQGLNVFYGDCFDKDSLVARLREARGEMPDGDDAYNDQMNQEPAYNEQQMNQDSVYSYNSMGQNAYGWDNGINVQPGTESNYSKITEEQNSFAEPFDTSGWIYLNPVPPNMPPPEYFDPSFDSR